MFDLCLLLVLLYCNRFANRPDQWKSKQASKQSAYKEFYATFGSSETKSSKSDSFLADTSKSTSFPKGLNKMRKEIDHHLGSQKNAKNKKLHVGSESAGAYRKTTESGNQIPFLSVEMKKKRRRDDKPSKGSRKKLKV